MNIKDIKSFLHKNFPPGTPLKTVTGRVFKIIGYNSKGIKIQVSTGSEYTISWKKISIAFDFKDIIKKPSDLVKLKIDTTTEPWPFPILQIISKNNS